MGSELSAELNPSIMCRSMNHLSTDHHRQDRACMGYRVSEYASCLRTKTIYPVPSPLGTSRVSTFVTLETCWLARMARLNHSCFEHQGPWAVQIGAAHTPSGKAASNYQDMHFRLRSFRSQSQGPLVYRRQPVARVPTRCPRRDTQHTSSVINNGGVLCMLNGIWGTEALLLPVFITRNIERTGPGSPDQSKSHDSSPPPRR